MGGCYTDYNEVARSYSRPVEQEWVKDLKRFFKGKKLEDILNANKHYSLENGKGFFAEVAKHAGISDIADIPKEFPETEYEVKFDLQPHGTRTEPDIAAYLDAFDFPAGSNTRFIKDPVNNIAEGTNHFMGDDLDEKLVVIEKAGKIFLKEKGPVQPLRTNVPYQDVVIKRTENRYEATMAQVMEKISAAASQSAGYKGKIRKEKGDAFVLDTNDGRIYSFTITRAHLTKPGDNKESGVQRQLEIEYAGFIPGFSGFKENSEEQIVKGMVDLARYTYGMYDNAPLGRGWTVSMTVTSERKYDFITGKRDAASIPKRKETILLPAYVGAKV